jgi:hypothetical protein
VARSDGVVGSDSCHVERSNAPQATTKSKNPRKRAWEAKK